MRAQDVKVGQMYRIKCHQDYDSTLTPRLHNCPGKTNQDFPKVGTLVLCEKAKSGNYSKSVHRVIQWADGTDPDKEYKLTVGNHQCLEPSVGFSMNKRTARAKEVEFKIKALESQQVAEREQIARFTKALEQSTAGIDRLAKELVQLQKYESDEEELADTLATILAKGADKEAILKVLMARSKTSLL